MEAVRVIVDELCHVSLAAAIAHAGGSNCSQGIRPSALFAPPGRTLAALLASPLRGAVSVAGGRRPSGAPQSEVQRLLPRTWSKLHPSAVSTRQLFSPRVIGEALRGTTMSARIQSCALGTFTPYR